MSDPGDRPTVVNLNDARAPVWYDIAVCHHWDGTLQTWVKAIDLDNPENRPKIAISLRQVADGLNPPEKTK
jgi:hypothetical protein